MFVTSTSIQSTNINPYNQVSVNQSDENFDAVWEVIKSWDINIPGAYEGYMGANGNHVQMILDSINKAKALKAYDAAMKIIP